MCLSEAKVECTGLYVYLNGLVEACTLALTAAFRGLEYQAVDEAAHMM